MNEYKETIFKIILLFFLTGVLMGMMAWNLKQADYIDYLEEELDEAREQLYISNDTLKQIQMFNEREYYIQQMEEAE